MPGWVPRPRTDHRSPAPPRVEPEIVYARGTLSERERIELREERQKQWAEEDARLGRGRRRRRR